MKKDSWDSGFEVQGSRSKGKSYSPYLKGLLFIVLLLAALSLTGGCRKKERDLPAPPATQSKAMIPVQPQVGDQKAPETSGQTRIPAHHSILTKDLNRPVPAASFSKNDRIYLVTVWTGLQGSHEIKVLWVRPDKTVQETVRLKKNIPAQHPTFTSWAYLSFTKGLLNLSPLEGKFIGVWKAQLFLDGNLLKEFDFTVF
jgi:hypothetical protein